jgi:hypothetical protein
MPRISTFMPVIRFPLLVLTVLVTAALLVYYVPIWQVAFSFNEASLARAAELAVKRFELENEARKTLVGLIAGTFGFLALYLTWRRVQATERRWKSHSRGRSRTGSPRLLNFWGNWREEHPHVV